MCPATKPAAAVLDAVTGLRYGLGVWRTATAATFVKLDADEPTRQFLQRASGTERLSQPKMLLHSALKMMNYSDFDVNGILDTYPLHLLSTAQLQTLVQHAGCSRDFAGLAPPSAVQQQFGAALDIGAGVGLVTEQLQPLCSEPVSTTETSAQMAGRLRRRGFECHEDDVAAPDSPTRSCFRGSFDLVSVLNVLDRAPAPRALLEAAHDMLRPGGWLLLATPLPFRPFYYDGARCLQPEPEAALQRRQPQRHHTVDSADRDDMVWCVSLDPQLARA
jgi:SAM-dependent methyltransferase